MQIIKNFKSFIFYLILPISSIYWIIIFFRNLFYDHGLFSIHKLPCSVISVGNLTVGGTGKTPTVIFLCNILKSKGKKVGIVSRGYGRDTKRTVLVSNGKKVLSDWKNAGDEPIMMANILYDIPIIVDKNRYRGGSYLINKFNIDTLIMDDGFQHRALHRNLDILLIDGAGKPSQHKILPFGALREPWKSANRADVIFITKKHPKPFLTNKIKKHTNPSTPIISIDKKFSIILTSKNHKSSHNYLQNKRVFLLSGIATPDSLIETSSFFNYTICGHKKYPDHFKYSQDDIIRIIIDAKSVEADCILTTEKDWVKIQDYDPDFNFVVIRMEFEAVDLNLISQWLD